MLNTMGMNCEGAYVLFRGMLDLLPHSPGIESPAPQTTRAMLRLEYAMKLEDDIVNVRSRPLAGNGEDIWEIISLIKSKRS